MPLTFLKKFFSTNNFQLRTLRDVGRGPVLIGSRPSDAKSDLETVAAALKLTPPDSMCWTCRLLADGRLALKNRTVIGRATLESARFFHDGVSPHVDVCTNHPDQVGVWGDLIIQKDRVILFNGMKKFQKLLGIPKLLGKRHSQSSECGLKDYNQIHLNIHVAGKEFQPIRSSSSSKAVRSYHRLKIEFTGDPKRPANFAM